jgi:hypothetical protein
MGQLCKARQGNSMPKEVALTSFERERSEYCRMGLDKKQVRYLNISK